MSRYISVTPFFGNSQYTHHGTAFTTLNPKASPVYSSAEYSAHSTASAGSGVARTTSAAKNQTCLEVSRHMEMYWGYIGIMEKKMETMTLYYTILHSLQ